MRRIFLILMVLLLTSFGIAKFSYAGDMVEEQVCDVDADFPLGAENYPEAIRRHIEVVRQHPEDALAHYHLGFAYGMTENREAEIGEYGRAIGLGLNRWDLFLNAGLAELQGGHTRAAIRSLRKAVVLGKNHYESHFTLAVAEDRMGALGDAEHEALRSLLLNPGQTDALNLLGVIYGQEGRTARACDVWRQLVREAPDYCSALQNLESLACQNTISAGTLVRSRIVPSDENRW
jgi:tetratricopeptide (TPR) repeat protein